MQTTKSINSSILWRLILGLLAISAIFACGTKPQAEPRTAPTPTSKPVATFVAVQVTAAPEQPPTPEPTAEGTPTTRGVPREFPEILKTTENISIGQLLSSWESYLFSGVLVYENNVWDLCNNEQGVAKGELIDSDILWTIGPPREGMLGNEVPFIVGNATDNSEYIWVAGYKDGSAVLQPTKGYKQFDITSPWELSGEPIRFEMYELLNCTNL